MRIFHRIAIFNTKMQLNNSRQRRVYHHCESKIQPSVMRYTLKRDDIPLLSQWIEKSKSFDLLFSCERAVKRCVNVVKNSKKYTGKLLDKLEFDQLFFKNQFPSLCKVRWHHFAQDFAITSEFFFSKMEEEKFSNSIVISKLKFEFSFEIREYEL